VTHVGSLGCDIQGQRHAPKIVCAHFGSPNAHRCRKPPSVTLWITRSIFTLIVRLIDRLAVNSGTGRASALVVCVDIIDANDQARVRHIDTERRIEMMFCGGAVEPDRRSAGPNLTMDRLSLGRSMDTSRVEPKCLDQEVVGSGDVTVSENRDDPVDVWHGDLRFCCRLTFPNEPRRASVSLAPSAPFGC